MRRYYTLDGLRGVAALVVLAGHSHFWLDPLPRPRAHLAVDLFFVLSGFVIAKGYEQRFRDGLSATQFLKQRIVRLWPLWLVGALIGIAAGGVDVLRGKGDLGPIAFFVTALTSVAMLPALFSATRGSQLYPLNNPGWSLAYEFFVNAVFAVIWPRLTNKALYVIVAAFAIVMASLALTGKAATGQEFGDIPYGVARVVFSFFMGVLIARRDNGDHLRSWTAWLALPLVALALYGVPFGSRLGPAYDCFMILAGFPLLVLFYSKIEPKKATLFSWLGLVSYPLYVVHEPLLFLLWHADGVLPVRIAGLAPVSGLAFAVAVLAASTLLAKWYDPPVRRWLSSVLSSRSERSLVAAATAP